MHPDIRHDALLAARHMSFIGQRLGAGALMVALLPLYLAMRGAPGLVEIVAWIFLAAPILAAYDLSRFGDLSRAHLISAFALIGLVLTVASVTGGIGSFAVAWLLLVPLEATLADSRKGFRAATAMTVLALFGLIIASQAGLLPPSRLSPVQAPLVAGLSILAALLYGASLTTAAMKITGLGRRIAADGEARYKMLAENMTDLITRHGKGGAVTFASHAATRLFGLAPDALAGQGLFDRVHVADRPLYLKAIAEGAWRQAGSGAVVRVRRETRPERRGGQPEFIWVEMRCRRMEAESEGDDISVVSVMRDVSESKAQEQAVEAARRDAERANGAKGQFLATVSHELRTPLNAIIGFAEMLMSEKDLRIEYERRTEYATTIRDSGHHLLSVVNSILDMSKLENGQFEILPERFALKPVIEGSLQLVTLKAEDGGLRLKTRLSPAVGEIVADKRAVRQIIINLLSNAVKFTDRGGQVEISTELRGGEVHIAVADTGIGIAEEHLSRLGEAFFQVGQSYDRRYEGTGLGLSVVKGLAELHGGRLAVESRLGEGTTVSVVLPTNCERPREDDERLAVLNAREALGERAGETRERRRA